MASSTNRSGREALDAGHKSLAQGAWGEARASFERAIESEVSPEALEGLGWAHYWLDEIETSMSLRERACRAFRERDLCRDACRVATALGLDALDVHGVAVATGWFELARRCLQGIEPCPEHGWLSLWEGHLARMLDNDTEEARRLGAEASEVGRAFGLADLEVLGDALVGLVLVNEGDVPAGMRKLDASMAAALVGELSDLYSVSATCCFLLHACEWVRDYERMAQWSARVDQFAATWNIDSMFTACRTQHASLLIGRGAWDEAEESLEKINTELMTSRPWFTSESLEQLGELRRRQGRWDEAEALFQKAGSRATAMLGRAQIALDRGAAAQALDCSERALRALSQARWTDNSVGLFVKVRAHLGVSDVAAANAVLTELDETARRFGAEFAMGLRHHAHGLLAAHSSDHDTAKACYGDAIAAFERSRAPYETARARIDMARTLAARGLDASAKAELETAASEFEALGAERDAERARELCSSPRKPGDGGKQALTARERQVVRLVADGLSDKAIASELGISGHTVHRHIANVLAKLDRPTRAAAVAYALRHRLI